MENASKALIIAGAILLSILIIAIGMYIYNSSQNTINEATSQISQQEIDAFNNTWLMYEGKQTGANVKALINKLIANANANAEEETKLPDLVYSATGSDNVTVNSSVGATGVTEFNTARTAIQSRHTYTITIDVDANTSLVSQINIAY